MSELFYRLFFNILAAIGTNISAYALFAAGRRFNLLPCALAVRFCGSCLAVVIIAAERAVLYYFAACLTVCINCGFGIITRFKIVIGAKNFKGNFFLTEIFASARNCNGCRADIDIVGIL